MTADQLHSRLPESASGNRSGLIVAPDSIIARAIDTLGLGEEIQISRTTRG
jgi:hypothetical protein